jgi:predicted  nucleic acid-binding Zn-ribbon protein
MALTDEDKAWIAGLFSATNDRLNTIDVRLDAIDARLDRIDTRLDAMDARFDRIDARLDKMDARFDRIDDQLIATNNRLDASTAHLTNYMLDMRTETIRRFDALDQRLEFMSTTLLNVQPLTKGMIDLGSLMSQLTRAQQQSTDRHFDLETRVMRLEEQLSKLIKSAA